MTAKKHDDSIAIECIQEDKINSIIGQIKNLDRRFDKIDRELFGGNGGGQHDSMIILKQQMDSVISQSKSLKKTILIIFIAVLPFLISAISVNLIDHHKVTTISNSYVKVESLELILNELNTQNRLLQNADLDTKEDVILLRSDLKSTQDRLDKLLETFRSPRSITQQNVKK